jgi:hypothetical protein
MSQMRVVQDLAVTTLTETLKKRNFIPPLSQVDISAFYDEGIKAMEDEIKRVFSGFGKVMSDDELRAFVKQDPVIRSAKVLFDSMVMAIAAVNLLCIPELHMRGELTAFAEACVQNKNKVAAQGDDEEKSPVSRAI